MKGASPSEKPLKNQHVFSINSYILCTRGPSVKANIFTITGVVMVTLNEETIKRTEGQSDNHAGDWCRDSGELNEVDRAGVQYLKNRLENTPNLYYKEKPRIFRISAEQ